MTSAPVNWNKIYHCAPPVPLTSGRPNARRVGGIGVGLGLPSKIAKQELTAAQQQKQIEALTATVQKVSEKIELNKTTPQLVANRR
jgi:hypothetical protein